MTNEEIFAKVRDTLVDSLGVDDDEVTLESRFQEDLGGESIDVLDVVFRLEKGFGIKIRMEDISLEVPKSVGVYDGGWQVWKWSWVAGMANEQGELTEAGAAEMRKAYADRAHWRFEAGKTVWDCNAVDMIVRLVAAKLAG